MTTYFSEPEQKCIHGLCKTPREKWEPCKPFSSSVTKIWWHIIISCTNHCCLHIATLNVITRTGHRTTMSNPLQFTNSHNRQTGYQVTCLIVPRWLPEDEPGIGDTEWITREDPWYRTKDMHTANQSELENLQHKSNTLITSSSHSTSDPARNTACAIEGLLPPRAPIDLRVWRAMSYKVTTNRRRRVEQLTSAMSTEAASLARSWPQICTETAINKSEIKYRREQIEEPNI
jgi:hypothetical protein